MVGNFDGQVYLASHSSVYCLLPQPWHRQVQVGHRQVLMQCRPAKYSKTRLFLCVAVQDLCARMNDVSLLC